MRKMVIFGFLVGFLSFACCAWAGAGASLNIGAGSMRLTLGTNSNGSLGGVISGSILVFANEVESVIFSSQRMGLKEYSRAKANFIRNSATITGLANNDSGEFMLKLKNGKYYKVNLENMVVKTANPMFYEINRAYLTYGENRNSNMSLFLETDGTVRLTAELGCDVPIGIRDLSSASGWNTVIFVTSDGITYSDDVKRDEFGNLSFAITGIVLTKPSQYENKQVTGKLYAVLSAGSLHQFEFNTQLSEDTVFAWYASAGVYVPNTPSLYEEYLELEDSIRINLWEPYVPM